MKEIVVSDSTCLICLERVGYSEILPALFDSVIVPPEVGREFGGKFDWLKVQKIRTICRSGRSGMRRPRRVVESTNC